ncbi:MAG: GspE/PulE family protein [Oscillospiraceae bacterium]
MRNGPIGQYLVEKNLLTEEQLQQVLAKQKETKGKLFGDVVVEMGFVSEIQFTQCLAERLNVTFIDLDNTSLLPDVVKKVPESVARKYNVIPVTKIGKRMTVATNDPVNFYIFEDIRAITGCSITPVLATKASINRAIGKMYSEGQVSSVVDEATKQKEEELNLDELKDISEDRIENAPIVKLATAIVENSFRQNATDIHIEPFKNLTKVRIRVNGDLIELMTLSSALHVSLVTRFKILSGMNIAEKRVPQDGRMSQEVDGTMLDLRVSNLPMVYGEKVVIRILATGDMSLRKITDLGMTQYNYERFASCLKVPQGVVLVTGPTGSGKSTTLYAALGEIAKPNLNVITVEDPVEKKVEGINQCQINEKAGMTFDAALRSILRQDPDIIMVGEMRDAETAEIAIRAAITGHLVLSTLHTNDAASTVTRLVDMGVEPYMVATSLIGIVAQRLTKVLCPICKKPRMSTPEENELMGIDHSVQIFDACGCPKCNNGYTGRTAIHEILLSTPEMASLITSGAKADQIQELAREQGCLLLRDNVSKLVQEGTTSIGELIRVTYAV